VYPSTPAHDFKRDPLQTNVPDMWHGGHRSMH